jgi:hypothetical protein
MNIAMSLLAGWTYDAMGKKMVGGVYRVSCKDVTARRKV